MAGGPLTSRRKEPRRDARENRDRLLAAAAAILRREGYQVPMARIAETAGLGVGTLYRHYPDRDALLEALTRRSFVMVLDLAEESSARTGPAIGAIDTFLTGTIAQGEHLVLPLHGGPVALSETSVDIQERIAAVIGGWLRRGRADGSVGERARAQDVIVFGAMLAQPLPNARGWTETAVRQKDIFLAGIAS